MSLTCEGCGAEVLEIDVKCSSCGRPRNSTGARRMLGNVVLGQYEIVDILGQGGMSVVYKARHKLTEQAVALKILPPELAAHSQVKSRFVEEARALALLDHPNIVHLYNFGEENGCFVLAMQYVSGQTFERMILDTDDLDWQVAVRVSIDVLDALEYAHGRGIIHRDMKPSNILVRDHDGLATVMDFGIAKMTNSTRLTATGQTMGTVRYMSPEQVRGHQVDARTDIYSLGASLYEGICGETPFDGNTHFDIMVKHLNEPPLPPSETGAVVPAALEAAVLRALAKKPDDRFHSAGEFRQELELILSRYAMGYAETMRVSRGSLSSPGRRMLEPSAPLSVAVQPHAPTAPMSLVSPERAVAHSGPVVVRPGGLITEPGGIAEDSLSYGSVEAPSEPAAASRPGSRSGPWIALVGAVAVVATGVVFYVTRTAGHAGSEPASQGPSPSRDAAQTFGIAVPAHGDWPEPFKPAEVAFEVDDVYADARLRVMAPAGWSAESILAAYQQGRALFAGLLEKKGITTELPVQPMTIAVVPRRVFCDPRVAENGKVSDECSEQEVFYRPMERTMLVVDDPKRVGANVAWGNAMAICNHALEIESCGGILELVDAEFEAQQKRKHR